MLLFEELNKSKVIIGMVHFPALPGFTLYNDKEGMDWVVSRVRDDLHALQNGGIDAVMFCNENDRPYMLQADFATVAAMARTIGELKSEIRVPFGVDVLWDPKAAIAVAKATGAQFVREIVTGTFIADMGFWNTSVGEVYKYRKLLDATGVKIFFNICAEFASPLDRRPVEEVAKSVVFSSLADAVLISGPMTGRSPDFETLERVKAAVGDVPVLINTGVNLQNVDELLKVADGAIVGTSLKKDGITWNPVDPERVKRFMERVESLR
ncbi:MAG: BtpA/SgcQ family protein [Thermotogae bacterium]|nr:BtpA/SgcQ family protein [Thermotogota bacterium]